MLFGVSMHTSCESKKHVVDLLVDKLVSEGYETQVFERYCFDIVARKKDDPKSRTLFVKALLNIDSFDRNRALELKNVSAIMDASPVIIGLHGRNFMIKEDSVHMRFDIPVVMPDTFISSLYGDSVSVISRKGRTVSPINTGKLRDERLEHGLSLDALSRKLDISKKTLYLAEKYGLVGHAIADKLESFFDEDLMEDMDLFDLSRIVSKSRTVERYSDNVSNLSFIRECIIRSTERMGYVNSVFLSLPSNLVGTSADGSLICDVVKSSLTEKHIDDLKRFGDFFQDPTLIISERENIRTDGVAVITSSEMEKIRSRDELIELIIDRK